MFKLLKQVCFLFFIFLISCSSNKEKVSVIEEKSLELQMIEGYKDGFEELEKGDVLYAAKKFNEAEVLFPQSEWAPKSVLLAAYAFYSQNYYSRAIAELERYIKIWIMLIFY